MQSLDNQSDSRHMECGRFALYTDEEFKALAVTQRLMTYKRDIVTPRELQQFKLLHSSEAIRQLLCRAAIAGLGTVVHGTRKGSIQFHKNTPSLQNLG